MTGEQFVPESERDRTAEAIAAVFETGHARLEAPLLTKDGTAIPYEYSANRVTGPEGDARLVGVGRDISERKRYERRLEQVQARTRELMHTQTPAETGEVAVAAASDDIDAPYAAVHVVDDSGDVLEPLAHRDAAGEFGEPPAYDPAGDRPATARFVWDVFEDQEAIYVPDTREHDRLAGNTGARSGVGYPLGDHGVLTVTATEPGAFGDADRSLLEILATAVTAALDRVEREKRLRERERELTRQNRRLDEFASVVSHDLRNPLNVASGRLELARERSGNGDLEDVARALDRMDALIEDLLALARRGEAVSEVEAVDLEDCVRDCWQTVETEAAVLTVETDATVRADRSRVQQLLANLVGNAVEHGGEDVTVTVGDLEEGFYVEDDGPGIPADQRDRVFEAGYSGSGAGTGFGLRIVEQVVEDHGWELDLTDGEDGGARFEVRGVERVA